MKIGSGWYGMGGGWQTGRAVLKTANKLEQKTKRPPTASNKTKAPDTSVSCILQKVSPRNKITHKIPGTW
jgi:hypothetical protein